MEDYCLDPCGDHIPVVDVEKHFWENRDQTSLTVTCCGEVKMADQHLQKRLVEAYYSTHYHRFMPRSEDEWRHTIQRLELNFGRFLANIPRDTPVLDLPCGVGYFEHYLLANGFSNIDAVDLSAEQIEVAKIKLAEYGYSLSDNVRFHVQDAFEFLHGKTSAYGAIMVIDFIEHLEKSKILEFLYLAHQALRVNGRILIRTINADNPVWGRYFYHDFTHETAFTPDSLRQCLSVVGFTVETVDYEILPRPSGIARRIKWHIRRSGLYVLGKFLGTPVAAFTEDLVAVGRKP